MLFFFRNRLYRINTLILMLMIFAVLLCYLSRSEIQAWTGSRKYFGCVKNYGVQSPPKFNFWILLVFLAFDVVVLQFVLTSAIQHSSFQFLYSNCPFAIACFTIEHCSLKYSYSTFKITPFNIQVLKMHVFDIQPQASQWQSVWAQQSIKILP